MFRDLLPDLAMATFDGVNVFHLRHENGATLIDCASESASPKLLKALEGRPQTTQIIVTHAHYDHAGGAAVLKEATGASIWMHSLDAELVSKGQWKRPYRHAGTPLSWLLEKMIVSKGPAGIPPFKPFKLNGEEQSNRLQGEFNVHHMPGHSAGQIALSWTSTSGKKVLFAADVCMNVLGLTQPIIYEDRAIGVASIKRLAELAHEVDLCVFGHGKPMPLSAQKLTRFAGKLSV